MVGNIERVFGNYDPNTNIFLKFAQHGQIIGREIRDEEIIYAHGNLNKVIKHLLGFYNVKGNVDVFVVYKGQTLNTEVVI